LNFIPSGTSHNPLFQNYVPSFVSDDPLTYLIKRVYSIFMQDGGGGTLVINV